MQGVKIIFTDEQLQWLAEHFADMKNVDLAGHLGCGWRTVCRQAQRMGLKKSPEFMVRCQADTARAAKESHLKNGTYPPKGFRIPRSEENRFRKGESPADRYGEDRWKEISRRQHEALELTRRREKARAVWCLPQRTRLRVERQPKAKIAQRYTLRRHGYIVDDRYAYYTDTTTRCPIVEARHRWFIFKPYEQEQEQH